MADFIEKTVTTRGNLANVTTAAAVRPKASSSQSMEYFIYFILGLLEVLLAFRLVLKLMGANTASVFVRLIYGFTSIFILPFEGIFRRGFTQGIEATAVFEPATLVALLVYAVLGWGIVQLVHVLSGEEQTS
jgi:hypothetical protein